MKILIYRWIDHCNFTIANSAIDTNKSAADRWATRALGKGADDGMVIVFSKVEKLYSHNTPLTTKQINNILKLLGVTVLKENDVMLINYNKIDSTILYIAI